MENVPIILTNIARANQTTPVANIRVVPQEVGQGKTFVIYIDTPKKIKNVEGSLGGQKLKFYKTGLSTGPHVHFGIIVGGVRVDPMEWINRVVLQ